MISPRLLALGLASFLPALPAQRLADNENWYSWRGPNQNGTSLEHYEGWKLNPEPVWTFDASGGSTPVIVDGRLFSFNYTGETTDLVENLTALDAKTGAVVWNRVIRDYISDTVYNRYAVGAATVDPETRNVYIMPANGIFRCYNFDGELQWEHSLMERFGRLTFPNGRAGAPVVDGDLVIVQGITAYWGAEGPARNRYLAFNKKTGVHVWTSTPSTPPKDSSFSTPIFETRNAQRIFYAGTGCGNLVGVNALTGAPLWRYHMSYGGVNSSPLIYKDTLIAIHGKENLDTSEEGRMVAVKIPTDTDGKTQKVLEKDSEVWRNPLVMFTSSPVLVGDRVYQITKTGNLACVNADTGAILWQAKLGNDNIHSSPLYADGLLYVPLNGGTLHVGRPDDTGFNEVAKVELEGNLLGAPTLLNGHLYVHSKKRLYCFKVDGTITRDAAPVTAPLEKGPATSLRAVPSDLLLSPGSSAEFAVEELDAAGNVVGTRSATDFAWDNFIPPTAKVKAKMDGAFADGKLVAGEAASAGAFKGTAGDQALVVRSRLQPGIPYIEDFESFELNATNSAGTKFAYPPLSWIGARFKFEVQDLDGNKVFAKTLDRLLFQRAMSFFGDPSLSNYTLEADVMSDGSRRIKGVVGLVNQRYRIYLDGPKNLLVAESNHERFLHDAPFKFSTNTWYQLKTKVSREGDNTRVQAKAWVKGEAEPAEWMIDVVHEDGHTQGSPGIFGFSPQAQKPVFLDNIKLSGN